MTTSTIYVTTPVEGDERPARYRGRHRRRRSTRQVGLTVLAAIWALGLSAGALATAGVGR